MVETAQPRFYGRKLPAPVKVVELGPAVGHGTARFVGFALSFGGPRGLAITPKIIRAVSIDDQSVHVRPEKKRLARDIRFGHRFFGRLLHLGPIRTTADPEQRGPGP